MYLHICLLRPILICHGLSLTHLNLLEDLLDIALKFLVPLDHQLNSASLNEYLVVVVNVELHLVCLNQRFTVAFQNFYKNFGLFQVLCIHFVY